MNTYTETEKEQALGVIESVVGRCEKVWPKFAEGTSQHSLLKNRIKNDTIRTSKCLQVIL